MGGMNSNLSLRRMLVVAATSVGFVVSQLDVSIVNVALASIGHDFGASVASLQWIVDSYALAFAALMLSAGALGDRFGARRLFAGGLALFAIASLACAFSRDAAQLIAARACQGVGAAAMLPNSLALLNAACGHDPRVRARAVGAWTAAGAVSIAAGPVVGGALIAAFGWRSIFWVNLPICGAGIAATFAWVRATPSQRRGGIDLIGQALAILALATFVGAVIEMRPLGPFHPLVLAGLIVALATASAFVAFERKCRAPMLPRSLFAHRTFSAAVLFGIGVNFTYYGMVFLLSLYLQRVLGHTPFQTGLAFLPLTGGFLLSNLASGPIVARFGARVPMMAGALVDAAGFAALVFVDAHTSTFALLLPFLLIPLGMGVAVPAMTSALLGTVGQERAGTASAVLNTARQAAGAIGVAAFGALAGHGESAAASAQIVDAVRASAGVSVAMLACAAIIAHFVKPEHRDEAQARHPRRAME
ncbi:MFS transporter [Caballeronia sp. Lep1P3]|uniref:MFS transporter n=1 Tax=Caballeronia sp. Lep1P3 TaxID=2878150 RepID=UPI001FD62BA3|nr:MFS transporter [Caballeronia sp. Lep1P3]